MRSTGAYVAGAQNENSRRGFMASQWSVELMLLWSGLVKETYTEVAERFLLLHTMNTISMSSADWGTGGKLSCIWRAPKTGALLSRLRRAETETIRPSRGLRRNCETKVSRGRKGSRQRQRWGRKNLPRVMRRAEADPRGLHHWQTVNNDYWHWCLA